MNIQELISEFHAIENRMSELIQISDSLGAKDSLGKLYWEEYKSLDELLDNRIKELSIGNEPDEMSDYIHDIILCDGEFNDTIPEGYSTIIVLSKYSTIYGQYKTFALVEPPNKKQYLILVLTPYKMEAGKKF